MRVTFGVGALRRLPDEVAALGLTRVLVLCSSEQETTGRRVADTLADPRRRGAARGPHMYVPVEVAAHRARTLAIEIAADGCVAVGGGSGDRPWRGGSSSIPLSSGRGPMTLPADTEMGYATLPGGLGNI
jgi:hypothetical protein